MRLTVDEWEQMKRERRLAEAQAEWTPERCADEVVRLLVMFKCHKAAAMILEHYEEMTS